VFSNGSWFLEGSSDSGEDGQALVEYALLLMLIAMVAVTTLEQIGLSVIGPLTDVLVGLGG
jgi:Flp pilus assembly pilin Flp